MLSKIKSHKPSLNWGLLLAVAVPAVLIAFYYSVWASDVFTSESQFVVRSPDRPATTSIGSLLQGTGFAKAQDDSHTVREYILSRDALKVLDEKVRLKEAYADRGVDIFSRFGGLDMDDSFEALHRYYHKKVDVQTDSTSGIVTLKVSAFGAKVAADANRVLLAQSEDLVNRLNERGRQDLIRYASVEATAAEKRAKESALALSGYRSAQNVVDPERQASVQLQQMAKLQDELIATNTQLSNLQTFTPANSQIPALRNRARILQAEIGKEGERVTGAKGSLANKAAEYQRLLLDSEFANKQLASALVSLEAARNEAQR
ncbi:MAG: hypothetical protein ABIR26_01925, partial [Ramlibacter sp.]